MIRQIQQSQRFGRFSEELYNETLHEFFLALEHILDEPEDTTKGPLTNKDGAIWLDRSNPQNADLKYKQDGRWQLLFNNRFKLICEIMSPTEPENPVNGQLWLNDGIMMYYNEAMGEWQPVKSVNVAKDFNLSSFEQFLIITPMQAAGNLVVKPDDTTYPEVKKLFKQQVWELKEPQRVFDLTEGYFTMGKNMVNVYVNGRRVANNDFVELTSNCIAFDSPVPADCEVLIEYVNDEVMANIEISINQVKNTLRKKVFKTTTTEKNQRRIFIPIEAYNPKNHSFDVVVGGTILPPDHYTISGAYIELKAEHVGYDQGKEILFNTFWIDTVELEKLGLNTEDPKAAFEKYIVDKLYTQFLLPSVDLDKVFINGFHNDDYEKVTNVAIQYLSKDLQGKVTTGVHVNPLKLVDIIKKVYVVDKTNPVIAASERFTEFYGITNGVGKLLVKSEDEQTDYYTVVQGIKLSPKAAEAFDFVVSVNYVFKNVKHQGSMKKGKVRLANESSIHIGKITDPLCVFTQGLYLDEDPANYIYDKQTGYIKIKLEGRTDVGVVAFPKKETGEIFELDERGRGIINVGKTYNKKLLFVYGIGQEGIIGDYEEVGDKLYVIDAHIGMKYAIVEIMGDTYEDKMFVGAGEVQYDNNSGEYYIPYNAEQHPDLDKVILFVNGLLIMKKDVTVDTANARIVVEGGVDHGLDFILLKDLSERYIFSDYVSFSSIGLGHKSDSVIAYLEDQFMTDAEAVYCTALPSIASIGELKMKANGTKKTWYVYNNKREWVEVTDEALIDKADDYLVQYTSDDYTINILQNFGEKKCTYYSYQYANEIEKPLWVGNIITREDKDTYRTAFNHNFDSDTNSLSIWQNGFRQMHDTTGDYENINGYFEEGESYFRVPEPISGEIFYVVERPENTEYLSCEREILTHENRITGAMNMYHTTIPLYPGNVRVFISGLRQPASAYKIIDANTIMIYNEIIGSTDNYPTETVENIDGEYVEITREIADNILIEVRQDYNLRELTIPVRYAGQKEFTTERINSDDSTKGGDELPEDLLESRDFIMIYINGMAYGKAYKVNRELGTITLTDDRVTGNLGKDPIDEYFKLNPDEYQKWREANDGKEYKAKPITDTITFEWR